MRISIVIPAYNEEKCIAHCLNSLTKQKIKEKFEVILVDNDSTDKTKEIASKYTNKLNLKIIMEKKKGRGSARYAGFKIAKGEIIVSTDADCVFQPTWLEALVDNLSRTKVVAVTGTYHFNDCSLLVNTAIKYFLPVIMVLYRLIFGSYWLSGFNFAIKKAVYLKAGGFNPHLNTQEDTDLALRIKNYGKIKFLPHLSVLASGRRFKRGLIRGVIPYIKTFIDYFYKKSKTVYLDDIRQT